MSAGVDAIHRCLGCGCAFVEERSLKLHLKHSEPCAQAHPQTFTCGKCHQQFQQLEALQQHVRRHVALDILGSTKPSGNKCKQYGKCFSQSDHLPTHPQIHSGDKPYKCKYCEKGFSRSDHYKDTFEYTQGTSRTNVRTVESVSVRVATYNRTFGHTRGISHTNASTVESVSNGVVNYKHTFRLTRGTSRTSVSTVESVSVIVAT